MRASIGYILLNVVPALGALIYTLCLTHIGNNPSRLKAKVKNAEGIPKRKLYEIIYSKRFMRGWMWISLSFSSHFLYELYKMFYPLTVFAAMAGLVVGLGSLIHGATLIARAAKV